MIAEVLVSLVIPLGLDLFMPVPDSNPLTPQSIELGRQLFFDSRLSRDRTVSCGSCHEPNHAFSDGRVTSIGVFGRAGRRNAAALVNRGYGRLFFWDGRARSLEEQVLEPIQDPNEMDLSLAEAEARVAVPADEISRALASYVRSLLSGNSGFDRFVNGDRTALSDQQQRGLHVFRGKGNCAACHAGGFATLDDVVDFYDRGGRPNPNLDPELRPLRLTEEEKRALVSFLRALSGS
jgi:cytochrome c peroxidase